MAQYSRKPRVSHRVNAVRYRTALPFTILFVDQAIAPHGGPFPDIPAWHRSQRWHDGPMILALIVRAGRGTDEIPESPPKFPKGHPPARCGPRRSLLNLDNPRTLSPNLLLSATSGFAQHEAIQYMVGSNARCMSSGEGDRNGTGRVGKV